MSKKRTKPIIDTIPGYTEKQTKYIRGEITDNEVNGQFYRWLLISATKINDKEIVEKAEKRIAQLKDEAAEKIENKPENVCIVYIVVKPLF